MSPTEISEELDVPESTVRGLATGLRDEGLLTDNYMFTKTGRDVAQHVLTQVDLAEPDVFEEGTVETELGQDEDEFFDDDGMLDI
ncbi:MAG: helix-turn-helix domain-containing protein [Candidatus Nanohalobium sp.]